MMKMDLAALLFGNEKSALSLMVNKNIYTFPISITRVNELKHRESLYEARTVFRMLIQL